MGAIEKRRSIYFAAFPLFFIVLSHISGLSPRCRCRLISGRLAHFRAELRNSDTTCPKCRPPKSFKSYRISGQRSAWTGREDRPAESNAKLRQSETDAALRAERDALDRMVRKLSKAGTEQRRQKGELQRTGSAGPIRLSLQDAMTDSAQSMN